jgi:hypothetical protein
MSLTHYQSFEVQQAAAYGLGVIASMARPFVFPNRIFEIASALKMMVETIEKRFSWVFVFRLTNMLYPTFHIPLFFCTSPSPIEDGEFSMSHIARDNAVSALLRCSICCFDAFGENTAQQSDHAVTVFHSSQELFR